MGLLNHKKDSHDSQDIQIYEDTINYYTFKKNPNFKYKLTITENNDPECYTHLFEVYVSHKDNKTYIASKNFNHNIDIYNLLDNKIILSLKGHEYNVNNVRYFINKKNYNEYLISSDSFYLYPKVIVWDITDNYNMKYKINTKYKFGIILSCLLIFPYNNKIDFIITSTSDENIFYKDAGTKKYSLNNGKLIKNIKGSNEYSVYYLLSWYNKKNNKTYLIQFCRYNVIISDLVSDIIYSDIDVKDIEHFCGIILEKKNTDYLIYSSSWGSFVTYDLYKKSIIKVVKIARQYTSNFIQWNENYFIFSHCKSRSFFVVDSKTFKIISQYKTDNESYPCCVKEVYHPKYGEALLVLRYNGHLQLWIV